MVEWNAHWRVIMRKQVKTRYIQNLARVLLSSRANAKLALIGTVSP